MGKFEYYKDFGEYEVIIFTPTLFQAFPFRMENITWTWRVRCFFEFFVGYKVYYIKKQSEWLGYCVVSSGRNRRYKFSTNKDIIYGRYFINEKYRGNGLAAHMLKIVLNDCEVSYENAYAYVHEDNIPSNKTMINIGAKEIDRFFIKGMLRNHLVSSKNGDFILYKYNRKG